MNEDMPRSRPFSFSSTDCETKHAWRRVPFCRIKGEFCRMTHLRRNPQRAMHWWFFPKLIYETRSIHSYSSDNRWVLRYGVFWLLPVPGWRERSPHYPHTLVIYIILGDKDARVSSQLCSGVYSTNNSSIKSTNITIKWTDDRRRRQERSHKSSYWRRCIRWMISRQSLNTLLMFSVSTAHVKCG